MIQALSEFNSVLWDIIGICFGFPIAITCIIGAICTIGSVIGFIFHTIYKSIKGIRNGK